MIVHRLKQKRQSMPEDLVWQFFIQLCLGIQALHRNNILHRCDTVQADDNEHGCHSGLLPRLSLHI